MAKMLQAIFLKEFFSNQITIFVVYLIIFKQSSCRESFSSKNKPGFNKIWLFFKNWYEAVVGKN